jgi:hypothetical protein
MNKPTPGPWVVNQNRPVAGCNGDIAITTGHESIVAVAFVRPDVEANAALIVAAVNACFTINPDNPLAVAEALPEIVKMARDILDAHWDMSPLEYANSRGLPFMSDEEGERIQERLRAALAKIEAKS